MFMVDVNKISIQLYIIDSANISNRTMMEGNPRTKAHRGKGLERDARGSV